MFTSSSLIALIAVATYYTTIHQHIITPTHSALKQPVRHLTPAAKFYIG